MVGENIAREWHSAQRWSYSAAASGFPDGLISTLNLVPAGGGAAAGIVEGGAGMIGSAADSGVTKENNPSKGNSSNSFRLLMIQSPDGVFLNSVKFVVT